MPTVFDLKEQEALPTPLVLFDCLLPDGTTQRWSTHRVTFEGNQYSRRVLRHNVFEMRWGADDGIDAVSRIAVTLANADSYISELAQSPGIKGARLIARFVFFDLKAGAAASSAMVLFQGLMNPPEEMTESSARLSAHNRLNLQRFLLPEIRIQRRCPWAFPATADQRVEALTGGNRGKYSPYYRCGYSPDQVGGAGNLNGLVPFTSCDYTRSSCEERGMFKADALGHATRRFGGIEFVPASILVRGHGDSSFQNSAINDNQARYNDFVPVHYGTVWTQPPVVFSRNDGNLTFSEVLLGMGEIQGVVKVLVNGVEIPPGVSGQNMTATGWYNVVTRGAVSGGFNLAFTDAAGQPLGDPYGSMAYLSVAVPSRIGDGKTTPQVKVLLQGLKLATFATDGSSTGEAFTNSPAWVLLDLLRRGGWTLDELDLKSFARAAAYCGELIEMNDLYGNARSVPRYQCNLTLRRRRSVADWVRGVRNASRLYVVYGAGGKLEVRIEGTIQIQQPAKPAGSNSPSTINGGWASYEFGDGTGGLGGILRKAGGASSVRLSQKSTAESPNRVSIEFQDQFNEYQQDSLSLVDVDDAEITRQEVSVSSTALGVPNFHQAARVLRLQLDKSIRGNLTIEFETSVKALGLLPGDLISVTYQKEGMSRKLFRITRILPSLNFGRVQMEAEAHDDSWFSDDVGAPFSGMVSRRQGESGIGLPRPLVGDETDATQGTKYSIVESANADSDGGGEVALEVGFHAPVKPDSQGSGIPLVSLDAQISTTAGTLAGGQTLFYCLTALAADGRESPVSFVVRADIPAGTGTNAVTISGLSFSPTASAMRVYRGSNPVGMLRIADGVAVAASFVDSGVAATPYGPPDENYDHAQFDWRLELQPEVAADSFGGASIGSSTLHLTVNEFAGMAVRITAGKGYGQERTIGSHTADTITTTTNWTTIPDATSRFVIVESSWKPGAATATSPARFAIPNRGGATVHIVGKAVNSIGRDSGTELSAVTRWQIGGAAGSQLDVDVPGAPVFGLEAAGQGSVNLIGVSFASLDNSRSVTSGTLTVHYWDELTSPSTETTTAAVGSGGTVVTVSATSAVVGSLIQIDSEVMEVQGVSGLSLTVVRGSHGTTAAGHSAGAKVYLLDRKVYVIPFAREFFGSPASGSFSYPIFLPDARIAAAEMFATNLVGNSESSKINLTGSSDRGLRTVSGGQFTMQVEGRLAIENDATPELVIDAAHSVRDIFATVQDAPTTGPVQVQLRQDDDVYCTLTIPAGDTISNVVKGFGMAPLRLMARLHLDILSVPSAVESVPGSDLTVTVRL